jgi:hypothetical protein
MIHNSRVAFQIPKHERHISSSAGSASFFCWRIHHDKVALDSELHECKRWGGAEGCDDVVDVLLWVQNVIWLLMVGQTKKIVRFPYYILTDDTMAGILTSTSNDTKRKPIASGHTMMHKISTTS